MTPIPWHDVPAAFLFAVAVLGAARLGWWLYWAWRGYDTHCVYDIDDAQGKILYTGFAKDPRERMKGHARRARKNPNDWWHDAHPQVKASLEPSRVVAWYRSEPVARAREIERIRQLQPPGNTIGTKHRGRAYRAPAAVPAADPMEE
jgi:hypothetical protein